MRYFTLVTLTVMLAGATNASAQRQFPPPPDLLARDRETSMRSGNAGLAAALDPVLDDDAVILYPGAPIIRSRASILAMLRAQPTLNTRVQWDPVHLDIAKDGSMALMYGTTHLNTPPDSSAQPGRFTSAWHHTNDGWRLIALALVNQPPARAFAWDSTASWASDSLAPLPRTNVFANADYEFSALAGRADVGTAFSTFVAPDGVIFPGGGQPFTRGPENIRRAFADGGSAKAQWRWWPVHAVGSLATAIGFTVGEAEIRSANPDGTANVVHTQYMTLWRRLPDGSIRFIADAGGQRPARVRR